MWTNIPISQYSLHLVFVCAAKVEILLIMIRRRSASESLLVFAWHKPFGILRLGSPPNTVNLTNTEISPQASCRWRSASESSEEGAKLRSQNRAPKLNSAVNQNP